jgi:tRNA (guanine37-N1)-methyltransferase
LKRALGATWLKRPDLLDKVELDPEQAALLREFIAEQQRKD